MDRIFSRSGPVTLLEDRQVRMFESDNWTDVNNPFVDPSLPGIKISKNSIYVLWATAERKFDTVDDQASFTIVVKAEGEEDYNQQFGTDIGMEDTIDSWGMFQTVDPILTVATWDVELHPAFGFWRWDLDHSVSPEGTIQFRNVRVVVIEFT
jgi:hypothetical protein